MECSAQLLALSHLAVELSPEDGCLLREAQLCKHHFTDLTQARYNKVSAVLWEAAKPVTRCCGQEGAA